MVFNNVVAGCAMNARSLIFVVSLTDNDWNMVDVDVATPRIRTNGKHLQLLLHEKGAKFNHQLGN